MLKVKNTAFVEFHRPGRLTFIFAILIPIVIFLSAVFGKHEVLLLSLIGAPLVILAFSISSKLQLLPMKQSTNPNYGKLKSTRIAWLYREKGKGVKDFDRNDFDLERTIADQSLFTQLQEIEIPDGLVEPEKVYGSNPSTAIGTIVGCIFCTLILIACVRLTQSTAPANFKMFGWFAIPPLCIAFTFLFFSFPAFQKNKNMPDFLRLLGKGQLFKKSFVAGPGWVKYGKQIWRGDTDILLVRRTGFRSIRAEIECMLVSKFARRKIRFSGVDDVDFRTLFGYWNVNEVRFEFIDSELS